ncbi:hypothetical protein J2X42_001792 [Arthrobacter sp. BE255]|nr:hypothetical protein [Arthrobacter sp. BE255]
MRIVGVRLSEAGPAFAGRLEEDGAQSTVLLLSDLQAFWSDPFAWASPDKETAVPGEHVFSRTSLTVSLRRPGIGRSRP